MSQRFESVDEYIASYPKEVQTKLQAIRRSIRKAVPDAEELISYHIPTYRADGWILYFAAFKNHYSLFGSIEPARRAFKRELAKYEGTGRGTIRFPLSEPVPVQLIRDIAAFTAKDGAAKKKKKTSASRGGTKCPRRTASP